MTHMGMVGYVATIASAAENTFTQALTGGALAWISGSDAATEGTFLFSSGPEAGTAMAYFNWFGGEPNNSTATDAVNGEDFIHMNLHSAGSWNDIHAGQANGYLIEYSSVSEPATVLILGLGLIGLGVGRRERVS